MNPDHLCKHFHDFLLADLPSSPPFKCPQSGCSFNAQDRQKLLTHYGGFHGIVERCLQDYLGVKVEEKVPVMKKTEEMAECQICGKGNFYISVFVYFEQRTGALDTVC